MSVRTEPTADAPDEGTSRRRFLTYLMAAPTLAVAVQHGLLDGGGLAPAAALPGTPEMAENYDLGDFLIMAQAPTESALIVLTAQEDGTVELELPRMEVGQGITTATAMLVADELSLPLDRVRVRLADARPELVFGQITGGSNTIRSVYAPIQAATAAFRRQMGAAAAARTGTDVGRWRVQDGGLLSADGTRLGFGELAREASSRSLRATQDVPVQVATKLVGTPQNRIDARAMVTGAFRYTGDLSDEDLGIPEPVLRSMVRRAPTIRGRVVSVDNRDAVLAMPGVVAVEVVEISKIIWDGEEVEETGVAVVAETSGQALDAKEALVVTWDPGPLAGESDETVRQRLRGINPPAAAPALPLLGGLVEGEFDFAFVSHAPLESNTAVAWVRDGQCDVWSGMKIPIVAQQTIADELGLAQDAVRAHVVQGGGSFGRKLFFDGAIEAARISQLVGTPVKHLWTRVDDMRHGRARSASHHRVRFTYAGSEVLSLEHRAAFVETDWRHGLGEALTAVGTQINPPQAVPVSSGGNATFSQSVFYLTVHSPYDTGATVQTLNELNLPFNTAAWRAVYSPNVRGAEEVMLDELAAALGEDPAELRLRLLPDARERAVLQKVLDLGEWGRPLPDGVAQGVAFHEEYKSLCAVLVEVDARDPLAPRVTRARIAADYGLPVNPRGLEAQLLGGLTDGIATVLRAGLHLEDGLFLEGSYSQFRYPRLRDVPADLEVFVFPETTGEPGGAGELGVTPAVGAVACAYARATGQQVRRFPVIHPIDFTPFPKGTGSTRVNPR